MIRIGFFNLENLFLAQEMGLKHPRKSHEKCLFLAKTILEMDLDILAVCEVGGSESLKIFSEVYLNNQYKSSLIEGNSDRDIHLGYLIKKTLPYKLEHYTHRNRPLNFWYQKEAMENRAAKRQKKKRPHPSELLSRDIAELRVLDHDDNILLNTLAIHLKSQLDSEGKDWRGIKRRQAELSLVLQTWKILQNRSPDRPVIILGDFNGEISRGRENEFSQIFKKTPLRELQEILQTRPEDRITWMGYNQQKEVAHTQLDYLFIHPKFENIIDQEQSGIYRFRGENGTPLPLPQTPWQRHHFPSDHFPLVLTLKQ